MPRFENCRIENENGESVIVGKDKDVNFMADFDLFIIKQVWGAVSFEDLADGFGKGAGTMGDWSGIRDSSPEARAKMFTRALNYLFPRI